MKRVSDKSENTLYNKWERARGSAKEEVKEPNRSSYDQMCTFIFKNKTFALGI